MNSIKVSPKQYLPTSKLIGIFMEITSIIRFNLYKVEVKFCI